MHKAIGETQWIIPDGFIPPDSSGKLTSHESICVVNCSSEEATMHITIFFEDQEPIPEIPYVVPGRRTKHIRTSSLHKDGMSIPVGVPYAMQIQSNIPIVVQYSRLDSTQAENALMSTMAYPVKGQN